MAKSSEGARKGRSHAKYQEGREARKSVGEVAASLRTAAEVRTSKRGVVGEWSREKKPRRINIHITFLTVHYNFTAGMVASILDVTPKTLNRYQQNLAQLSEQQADRLQVLESILALGERVLGSEDEVRSWLQRPVQSLDNQRPMDLVTTESGRRRIENVLLQVEAGVY